MEADKPTAGTPATPTELHKHLSGGRQPLSSAKTERRPAFKINPSPPTSLCRLGKPSTSPARARARRHRTLSQCGAGPRGKHFRSDRTPPDSPPPPAPPPPASLGKVRRASSRRLTLGQLHGARAAQRARQTVELLHRSLHPRRGLGEIPRRARGLRDPRPTSRHRPGEG